MKLTDKAVTDFLDDLASNLPAPGGGSVAALSGALGAALVSMVCNLTLGKKGYEGVQADIEALLAQSEALRREMVGLLEADVAAYTAYSQTAKMPKDGGQSSSTIVSGGSTVFSRLVRRKHSRPVSVSSSVSARPSSMVLGVSVRC